MGLWGTYYFATIIMAPAWLVGYCELDRTLYVYAGVGVSYASHFLGWIRGTLWEEGNTLIDCGWQLPLYIDPLMDIYYLTNKQVEPGMKYEVLLANYWNSNMQGGWRIDLQSKKYGVQHTKGNKRQLINVVVDSLQPWSNALSINPASTIDVSKYLDR